MCWFEILNFQEIYNIFIITERNKSHHEFYTVQFIVIYVTAVLGKNLFENCLKVLLASR